MASKYLATGTATFTAATRTIAGASMSAAFAAGDVGRAVSIVKGGAVFFGTVATVVGVGEITLTQGAGIPTTDGTVTQLLVIDTGRTHEYADYIAEIESKVQQDQEKVDLTGRKACLQEAIGLYNKDRPYVVPVRVAGNGTDTHVLATALGSLWIPGQSGIDEIEYPMNEKPAAFLDDEDYRVYDDGTVQDGTATKLVLMDQAPGTTEYFVIHTRTPRILDEATPANFPDTPETFSEITMLAASLLCERLATAYAQSSNAVISADVVDYHGKTEKYRSLAKGLRALYNSAVFGSVEGRAEVQPVIIEKPIGTTNSQGGAYLFHRSRR